MKKRIFTAALGMLVAVSIYGISDVSAKTKPCNTKCSTCICQKGDKDLPGYKTVRDGSGNSDVVGDVPDGNIE
ncbi:hypothetical protein ACWGOQ_0006230 [Aquimarina sp. M1]